MRPVVKRSESASCVNAVMSSNGWSPACIVENTTQCSAGVVGLTSQSSPTPSPSVSVAVPATCGHGSFASGMPSPSSSWPSDTIMSRAASIAGTAPSTARRSSKSMRPQAVTATRPAYSSLTASL
jgi:hypothetical protein